MNEKAMKKLGRSELLQLLIEYTQENEEMREKMDAMSAELDSVKNQLKVRTIAIENAGSLAEAMVQINGMFDAAQKTADQYLENIERMQAEQEATCAQRLRETNRKCIELEKEAEARCLALEAEAQRRCEELLAASERDAGRNWHELSERLDRISRENEELRSLLETNKKRKWRL